MDAERSALEEMALAEFAADSGIVLDAESPATDGPATEDQKTM